MEKGVKTYSGVVLTEMMGIKMIVRLALVTSLEILQSL